MSQAVCLKATKLPWNNFGRGRLGLFCNVVPGEGQVCLLCQPRDGGSVSQVKIQQLLDWLAKSGGTVADWAGNLSPVKRAEKRHVIAFQFQPRLKYSMALLCQLTFFCCHSQWYDVCPWNFDSLEIQNDTWNNSLLCKLCLLVLFHKPSKYTTCKNNIALHLRWVFTAYTAIFELKNTVHLKKTFYNDIQKWNSWSYSQKQHTEIPVSKNSLSAFLSKLTKAKCQ